MVYALAVGLLLLTSVLAARALDRSPSWKRFWRGGRK